MITGEEGGCVHQSMPPIDWCCGPIPTECYDPSLSILDIERILLPIYLAEERIKKLANSDNPNELLRAKLSLEIIANIDATTIWCSIN